MEKLLLTGGLGYIGSKFLEKFSNYYEITILDTNFFFIEGYKDKNFIRTDIRNLKKEQISKFDYVVHMSELSNDPLGKLNPGVTKDINHNGTKLLLNLCNNTNIKKFIYMSSASVYGYTEEESHEDSKINPLTDYAKSKVLNENYIVNHNFDFQTIILRNSTAFGFSKNMRLDLVINDLVFSGIRDNKLNIISDGTPKRPFVHISDICNFIHKFIQEEKNFDNEIFNIGSKNLNLSIRDVAKKVADHLNIEDLTFGAKDVDQRSYYLNFNKLTKTFNDFDFDFDLDTGIRDLVDNLNDYKLSENEIRIEKINKLINEKRIDNYLNWI